MVARRRLSVTLYVHCLRYCNYFCVWQEYNFADFMYMTFLLQTVSVANQYTCWHFDKRCVDLRPTGLFLLPCPLLFIHKCLFNLAFDVEYIYGFVWCGSASKVDDVTALPSRHRMADMCYYGNVMTTTRWWLCVTILHLQQYSHRLNLFLLWLASVSVCPVTFQNGMMVPCFLSTFAQERETVDWVIRHSMIQWDFVDGICKGWK